MQKTWYLRTACNALWQRVLSVRSKENMSERFDKRLQRSGGGLI